MCFNNRMAATDPSASFGERIQSLRRERKLTQIDLSSLSGLSKSYVSFLESDVRHPSRDAVFKLAEALRPGEPRLRDELLILAGFMPQDLTLPSQVRVPAYAREDFKSFLQHSLQLIRQQDFDAAQKEIEQGFQRFRRPVQIQTLLAHLELARGAFEQAILFQKTALQHYDLSPDEQEQGLTLVDFILNLGVMYFLWGDQALFAAQEESVKTEATRLRKLARERYEQALETYRQGLEQAPAHLYLLDEVGRVHFNLADLQRGARADAHWDACISCFRQVLAHPDKLQLAQLTLRETGAFLALALAHRKNFEAAFLLLDALTIDGGEPWSLWYIQACCAVMAYRQRAQESLLDQALTALANAHRFDPAGVSAQFERDKERDFAPLIQHRGPDLEKMMARK